MGLVQLYKYHHQSSLKAALSEAIKEFKRGNRVSFFTPVLMLWGGVRPGKNGDHGFRGVIHGF